MAAKKAPANRKRKRSESRGGHWLLYPFAVLIGTTAGVVYYFQTSPPSRGTAANQPTPVVDSRPVAKPGKRRPPERVAEPDVPAVNIRTVPTEGPEPAPPGNASLAQQSAEPLPPTEIEKGSGGRPEVGLTFDAGADWKPVKQILEALDAQSVKATFFLTGEWVQSNPKTTRLIVDQGHEIGNHSWNHPAFTKLDDAAIREQLRRTDEIIQEVTGKTSRPYFRPPLGDRDPRVRSIVGEEGFFTIYWTLDSRDSVDRGITANQIKERVLGKSAAGSIVLLHCGSQATADALPGILEGLKSRGLNQVPLSRLLQE